MQELNHRLVPLIHRWGNLFAGLDHDIAGIFAIAAGAPRLLAAVPMLLVEACACTAADRAASSCPPLISAAPP